MNSIARAGHDLQFGAVGRKPRTACLDAQDDDAAALDSARRGRRSNDGKAEFDPRASVTKASFESERQGISPHIVGAESQNACDKQRSWA